MQARARSRALSCVMSAEPEKMDGEESAPEDDFLEADASAEVTEEDASVATEEYDTEDEAPDEVRLSWP